MDWVDCWRMHDVLVFPSSPPRLETEVSAGYLDGYVYCNVRRCYPMDDLWDRKKIAFLNLDQRSRRVFCVCDHGPKIPLRRQKNA